MKNKKLIFSITTMIWTAVIFAFSLQSGDISGDLSGSVVETIISFFMPGILDNPEQVELLHLILRKCAHFTEFMILGLLARNAMQYIKLQFKTISTMTFCVSIAAVDETLQLFVSGRAGRVQDVLIDSVGVLVGIVVVVMYLKRKNKK